MTFALGGIVYFRLYAKVDHRSIWTAQNGEHFMDTRFDSEIEEAFEESLTVNRNADAASASMLDEAICAAEDPECTDNTA